ncbi:MAG: hypothetical protein ACO3P1_07130, partial [Pseudomonadales bacterium]
MKWFHFSIDTSIPGPVWTSLFWQKRHLLRKTVDLIPLSLPPEIATYQRGARYSLRSHLSIFATARELRRMVEGG